MSYRVLAGSKDGREIGDDLVEIVYNIYNEWADCLFLYPIRFFFCGALDGFSISWK